MSKHICQFYPNVCLVCLKPLGPSPEQVAAALEALSELETGGAPTFAGLERIRAALTVGLEGA